MPDFSGMAIGFMLELQENFTPTFDKVEKGSLRFARALDRTTSKSVGRAATGMDQLARAAKAVDENTKGAADSMAKVRGPAARAGRRGAAAGKQQIEIHLKPQYPTTRVTPFDRTNLRRLYHDVPQPPDYQGTVALAKGGVVREETVAKIGEAGAEAVVPLTKSDDFKEVLKKAIEEAGGVGLDIDAVGKRLEQAGTVIIKTGDSTPNVEELTQAIEGSSEALEVNTEAAKTHTGVLGKLGAAFGVVTAPVRKVVEWTRLATEKYNALDNRLKKVGGVRGLASDMWTVTKMAAGATSSLFPFSFALGKVRAKMKESHQTMISWARDVGQKFITAIKENTGVLSVLGVASLGVAASIEKDWVRTRQAFGMTASEFKRVEKIGLGAMANLGLTSEETFSILGQAAHFKIKGQEELTQFTTLVGQATEAFEGMGVTAEEWGDTVYNVLQKSNLAAKEQRQVLGSMAYIAEQNAIEFSTLKSVMQANVVTFQALNKDSAGTAKSMTEFAAVVGGFSQVWGDAEKTGEILGAMMDPAKIQENSEVFNLIVSKTGKNVFDLQRMIKEGEFGEFGVTLMEGIKGVDTATLNRIGSDIERIYGLPRDMIFNIKTHGDPAKIREAIKAAYTAGPAFILKRFKDTRATFFKTLNDIKMVVFAFLADLGRPILQLTTVVLQPFLWALRTLQKAFAALPGPIKFILGAIVFLVTAFTGLSAIITATGIASTLFFLAGVAVKYMLMDWVAAQFEAAFGVTIFQAAVKGATAAVNWFKGSLWSTLAPFAPIIIQVAIVVGAMYLLYRALTSTSKAIQWLGLALGSAAFFLIPWLATPLLIVAGLIALTKVIKGFVAGLATVIAPIKAILTDAIQPLIEGWNLLKQAISLGKASKAIGVWDVFTGVFKALGVAIGQLIKVWVWAGAQIVKTVSIFIGPVLRAVGAMITGITYLTTWIRKAIGISLDYIVGLLKDLHMALGPIGPVLKIVGIGVVALAGVLTLLSAGPIAMVIAGVVLLSRLFNYLPGPVKTVVGALGLLVGAIYGVNWAVKSGTISTYAHAAAMKITSVTTAIWSGTMKAALFISKAYNAASQTGAIRTYALAAAHKVGAAASWLWQAAIWAVNLAMNMNPIGLVILGIAALIAVVIVVVKYWDYFAIALKAVGSAILWLVMVPFKLIIGALSYLWAAVKWVSGILFGDPGDSWLVRLFQTVLMVVNPFYLLYKVGKWVWGFFFDGGGTEIGKEGTWLDTVGVLAQLLLAPFMLVYKVGKSLWDFFFGGAEDGGWLDRIGSIAKGLLGPFKLLGGLIGGVLGIAGKVWGGITKIAGKAWEGIKGAAGKVWDGMTGMASKAWEGAKNIAGKAWEGIKGTAGKVWGGMTGMASAAWEGIKGTASKAWEGIKGTAGKVWGWLTGAGNEKVDLSVEDAGQSIMATTLMAIGQQLVKLVELSTQAVALLGMLSMAAPAASTVAPVGGLLTKVAKAATGIQVPAIAALETQGVRFAPRGAEPAPAEGIMPPKAVPKPAVEPSPFVAVEAAPQAALPAGTPVAPAEAVAPIPAPAAAAAPVGGMTDERIVAKLEELLALLRRASRQKKRATDHDGLLGMMKDWEL